MGFFSAKGADVDSFILAVVVACRGVGASEVPAPADSDLPFC